VRYQEYAGFTNLTFHVTDKFDIQGGVRQSHIKIERTTALSGAFNNPPTVLPLRTADADAFTFLFSPRYKFSEELMVYGRIASGYRAGGPSANTQLAGVPPTFEPDRTINYELGMKGSTLEGALGFDVSAYYIDWRDIQLRQVLGTFGFVSNGGKAKSEGIEVSIDARPWTGMSLDTWVAWNDATLTESLPSGPGLPRGDDGERLPYSARISAGLNATQRFPVRGSLTAFAGFSLNYVGDRISDFSPVAARLRLAPYAKTDVQFGLESAAWRFNAFVNNVADRRGRIAVSFVTPNTFTIIQPRTYGVSVQRNF
jgi:iron complex outermembrane receptor protein